MQVTAVIEYTELENDEGHLVDSVEAACTRCGHITDSYGTSSASVRRCLVLLREECPNGESNFYVAEGGEDDDDG